MNQNGLGVRIQGFKESESQFGEWPHMCAVLHEKTLEQEGGYSGEPQTVNLYQCGGSLIAPGVILTAAHCVDNFETTLEELKVRCGEWDTQNETEPFPHQDRYVQAMKLHPEFNAKNLHNDFAVLFTSQEFNLSSHIDTICLPDPKYNDINKTDCFATGWGKDRFGSSGEYQVVLKEIDLPLVENNQCQDLLKNTRLGNKFQLDDSFLCAGGVNGKDTCHGDGGGPVVCKSKSDPETYIQTGIVSWGVGCGEDGTPGVYAAVPEAACWIDYVMSCQGQESESVLSVLGYSRQVCDAWVEKTILGLTEEKQKIAKHLIPTIDAEIEQFNKCKVTWYEGSYEEGSIPDGSKLVQDENVDIHDLSKDTGYGDIDGGEEAESEHLQANDDSSYVTEAYETTSTEETYGYGENENVSSETEEKSAEIDISSILSDSNEILEEINNSEQNAYDEKDSNEYLEPTDEIDVISILSESNEQLGEIDNSKELAGENTYGNNVKEVYEYLEPTDEIYVSSILSDSNEHLEDIDSSKEIAGGNGYGENEYIDSTDEPVHISDFGNGVGSENNYLTKDEAYADNGTSEDQEEDDQEENTSDVTETTTNEITKIGEANLPNDYVAGVDDGFEDQASVEVNYEFENCEDYTEKYGYECVPYYQCHNGTIITDGAGLIDIRNGFGSLTPEDSKCPGFLDVCCKDPDFIPPPPPKIKYAPSCERRNQNGLGVRIQGFTESESQFGEWPHMCAVLHEKPLEQEGGYSGEPQTVNLYQCGGSLIAPGVILTAAHCVDNFETSLEELKVRCGEWDTQNETEPYPHQDRSVQAMKLHPEFNAKNLHNDFAVLFTSQEFNLSSHIDTICLPDPEYNDINKTDCFATGWGKDRFGSSGEYQVVLKEIDLPLVENNQCQELLKNTRLGNKFKLDDSFLCAGGVNGKDTCHGDGGGPLVCKSKSDPETYIQTGIVSWGVGCGEDGTPGVYAAVSEAACWIDYVMSCQGQERESVLSVLGYSRQVCDAWVEKTILGLTEEKQNIAKHLIPTIDAEIEQFNKCKVTWYEGSYEEGSIPDGSKLVQDKNVDIHDLSKDTGYGDIAIDGGEEAESEHLQANDDSSYVTEAYETTSTEET